uniref:Uncharacterized protein n=1 Tax=Oryza rufipogon TaxID=4529 RepID=A0A0E0NX07_ORYRU
MFGTLDAISSSQANFVVSARQEDLCSHYNSCMMKSSWHCRSSLSICSFSAAQSH